MQTPDRCRVKVRPDPARKWVKVRPDPQRAIGAWRPCWCSRETSKSVPDERSSNRDVQADAHANHRDTHHFVGECNDLVGDSQTFVAEQQDRGLSSRLEE